MPWFSSYQLHSQVSIASEQRVREGEARTCKKRKLWEKTAVISEYQHRTGLKEPLLETYHKKIVKKKSRYQHL